MINLGARKEEFAKTVSNLNKKIVPGSGTFTITGMQCVENNYNNVEGFDISLLLEGEDLTAQGFEGFMIDMDKPELGRFKGATGRVKLSRFAFASKSFPATATRKAFDIDRDTECLSQLSKFAKMVGKYDELFSGEVADIPSAVVKAGELFAGSKIKATIGGREWIDKKNYVQFDLYLVAPESGYYNAEAVTADPSNLQEFNAAKHIIKAKAKAADAMEIEAFEPMDAMEPFEI